MPTASLQPSKLEVEWWSRAMSVTSVDSRRLTRTFRSHRFSWVIPIPGSETSSESEMLPLFYAGSGPAEPAHGLVTGGRGP
ncbi:MAG: hypothetical protein AAF467_03335 [Actinomycetota bacterium]